MKIFSWNRQGINNPETVQALRNWCWRERPDFFFIMESMIDRQRFESVRNICGFHNVICISSQGSSGGIGLWWRDQKVCLKSFSDRHIFVVIDWMMLVHVGWLMAFTVGQTERGSTKLGI